MAEITPDANNSSNFLARSADVLPRLSVPQMKKRILEKDVLDDLMVIAKTGCRRVWFEEKDVETGIVSRKESYEPVQAKEHVAVLKMLIDKVLPNTKEVEEIETDHGKWQQFTDSQTMDVRDMDVDTRQTARDVAKYEAVQRMKGDWSNGL